MDEHLLNIYGITIKDVAIAVKKDNVEITGGELKTPEENILIRARNKNYEGVEFEEVVIKALPNGNIIRLKDVAVITDGWIDQPAEQFVNGVPSVIVKVSYTIHEDLKSIAEKVKAYVADFEKSHPQLTTQITRDSSKV